MSSCQVVKLSSILDVIFVVKGKTRSKNLPHFFRCFLTSCAGKVLITDIKPEQSVMAAMKQHQRPKTAERGSD